MSLEITAEAIAAFVKRFEAAGSSRSFDDVIEMLHPAALFRFNDDDYRGLEAIGRAFEATWAYDIEDEQYTLTDIDAMHVAADWGIVTFTYHWSGVAAQGPFHATGRGSQVIVIHDGRLVILLEHLSRDTG